MLQKYLDEYLSKEFIKVSLLPIAIPVIFIKKPSSSLYFYIDYQALNTIIIKNQYPLLLIQEILNRLSKAYYYIKLNLIYIFNHLHITKGDKWLTIFYTQYRLFKYLITLFSLINALNLF